MNKTHLTDSVLSLVIYPPHKNLNGDSSEPILQMRKLRLTDIVPNHTHKHLITSNTHTPTLSHEAMKACLVVTRQ